MWDTIAVAVILVAAAGYLLWRQLSGKGGCDCGGGCGCSGGKENSGGLKNAPSSCSGNGTGCGCK